MRRRNLRHPHVMAPEDPMKREAWRNAWRAYHIEERRCPHFVYRQFDADDRLLYVGCTVDPHRRGLGHKRTPWIHLVARTEYEMHPNYWVATAHESHYIATEGSLYNALGSPDRAAAMARRAELAAQS